MHFSWSSCRFILTFEQVFSSEWSDKIATSPQTTLKLWHLNTHKHTQVYSRDPMQGWECTGRRQHTIKSTSSESWYHSNQSCLSMWPSGPKNRQWAPLSPNPRTQAGTVAELSYSAPTAQWSWDISKYNVGVISRPFYFMGKGYARGKLITHRPIKESPLHLWHWLRHLVSHTVVSQGSISSAVVRGCVLIKGRQICLFRVHTPVCSTVYLPLCVFLWFRHHCQCFLKNDWQSLGWIMGKMSPDAVATSQRNIHSAELHCKTTWHRVAERNRSIAGMQHFQKAHNCMT